MPRKPEPLVVEVVYAQDPAAARIAQKEALKLLVRYILEDRHAEIPDTLLQPRIEA